MKKRILVAPLNWGIGHACRCIPIINALIQQDFEVVIASDNDALTLLKKEFPKLTFTELPSYNITYAKHKKYFKTHLLKQLPGIYKTIKAEHKATQQIIANFKIDGIISDNRLGVYSKKVHSVFITHQIKVFSGNTTWFSTKIHNYFIKNFNACWIPDFENLPNLSGQLSHSSVLKNSIPTQYIGALSRFNFETKTPKYALLILLSGPEPQRGFLEKKLLKEFETYNKPVLFVKGTIEEKQTKSVINKMTIYNFLTSKELEIAINSSDVIICRSGYTSIMDLAKLKKNAFFIPTPGQFEQEYLAKHLSELKMAPFCNQDDFSLKELDRLTDYKGLNLIEFDSDLPKDLFCNFV